jgi:uncharacterized protein (TIGR02118 family)
VKARSLEDTDASRGDAAVPRARGRSGSSHERRLNLMIRITLIYRGSEDAHFDFDYYVNHHVKMSRRLLSDCGLLSIEVQKSERTLDGEEPDVICISHVDFESEEGLARALEVHGADLMADFPNYTTIDPEIYVCSVLTSGT